MGMGSLALLCLSGTTFTNAAALKEVRCRLYVKFRVYSRATLLSNGGIIYADSSATTKSSHKK